VKLLAILAPPRVAERKLTLGPAFAVDMIGQNPSSKVHDWSKRSFDAT